MTTLRLDITLDRRSRLDPTMLQWGSAALDACTSGYENVAVGKGAGSALTNANSLTAVGFEAALNTTVSDITAFGHKALRACTTGNDNVACRPQGNGGFNNR